MKLVLAVVDAARVDALRGALAALGVEGYTVLPVLEGAGRTGVHTGDRVHPGALVAVFSVVEDSRAAATFDELVRWRETAHDPVTRFFLLPVERQA